MQKLEHSPATSGSTADGGSRPGRHRGRRETPWGIYAIKGGFATLALLAAVGLVFALVSGVWGSAIAAVVALVALAALVRPTWRMLDATYGSPVNGERAGNAGKAD